MESLRFFHSAHFALEPGHAQPDVGLDGWTDLSRVDDDQLGAALGRLLEEGRGDRMVGGRARADDDDAVGLQRVVEGGRHRARADAFHQRGDRRGVAEPRAVVDIVGSKTLAHQLLEQVGLFIRALGRSKAGQRLTAARVEELIQAAGRAFKRFIPCGYAVSDSQYSIAGCIV